MSEIFIDKLKQVKSNVENAKYQLNLALNILGDDVTINNNAFQKDNIDDVLSRLNTIITGVDKQVSSVKQESETSEEVVSEEDNSSNTEKENTSTTPTKPPVKKNGPVMKVLD